MMQERYSSDSVIERGYAIYDEWNENKYKSRKIVNSVQMAVASSNAKRTPEHHVTALSHLFALDLRIKERYDNIFKCIILYFSWRRETGALKTLKSILKLPEGKDIRDIIEIELERLRQNIDGDKTEGTDKKNRGGKVNEFSGAEAEAAVENGDQISETAEEKTPEESLEKEETAEQKETSENVGAEKPIEDQADESQAETAEERTREQAHFDAKEKAQTKSDSSLFDKIKSEKNYEKTIANNGFENKNEPNTDKKTENVVNNNPIDISPFFEEGRGDNASSSISFIDEVMMDNMIKGENDVIGHNPLESVGKESAERSQPSDALGVNEKNEGGKDAHLYDKIVLKFKGESSQNESSTSQNDQNAVKEESSSAPNEPNEVKAESNAPQEKTQVVINNKSDEARTQIKVEENISEENKFRRSVNDKFTVQMINIHKSLMEDAFREEFIIPSERMGDEAPVK